MYDFLLPNSMNGLIILSSYCKNINEKVAEACISSVFSLRHQVGAIFKNDQYENRSNVAVN